MMDRHKAILDIAQSNFCDVSYVGESKTKLEFRLDYACEGFFRDLNIYGQKNSVGWFIKSGNLMVYKV